MKPRSSPPRRQDLEAQVHEIRGAVMVAIDGQGLKSVATGPKSPRSWSRQVNARLARPSCCRYWRNVNCWACKFWGASSNTTPRDPNNALPGSGRHTRRDGCTHDAMSSDGHREEAPAQVPMATASWNPRCRGTPLMCRLSPFLWIAWQSIRGSSFCRRLLAISGGGPGPDVGCLLVVQTVCVGQTVRNYAKEKSGDQDCSEECKNSSGIHWCLHS
jgi:hypothetical protein